MTEQRITLRPANRELLEIDGALIAHVGDNWTRVAIWRQRSGHLVAAITRDGEKSPVVFTAPPGGESKLARQVLRYGLPQNAEGREILRQAVDEAGLE